MPERRGTGAQACSSALDRLVAHARVATRLSNTVRAGRMPGRIAAQARRGLRVRCCSAPTVDCRNGAGPPVHGRRRKPCFIDAPAFAAAARPSCRRGLVLGKHARGGCAVRSASCRPAWRLRTRLHQPVERQPGRAGRGGGAVSDASHPDGSRPVVADQSLQPLL